jgi:hypothetical protein
MEAWYKIACPHCQKTNWANAGNLQDYDLEPEAILCFSCNQKFVVEYDLNVDEDPDPDDKEWLENDAYTVKGTELPSLSPLQPPNELG